MGFNDQHSSHKISHPQCKDGKGQMNTNGFTAKKGEIPQLYYFNPYPCGFKCKPFKHLCGIQIKGGKA